MIGRSYRPWWRQLLGGDMVMRMVQQSEGFDLYIVSTEAEEDREP